MIPAFWRVCARVADIAESYPTGFHEAPGVSSGSDCVHRKGSRRLIIYPRSSKICRTLHLGMPIGPNKLEHYLIMELLDLTVPKHRIIFGLLRANFHCIQLASHGETSM